MGERLVGVIQNVLIGPWYAGVYDLLLTDQRFLFLFVEKFSLKTRMEPRNPSAYSGESVEVMSSRERSSAVLYSSVKKIRQGIDAKSNWRRLAIEYESRDGTMRILKLLLAPLDFSRIHQMSAEGHENKLAPVAMDEEVGIELLLSKAMPGMSF